ncbi:MAG: hypothetical protein JHD35_16335, partial [Sphingopyxis sp.]|nr:hypothetical protein [Sphingopyxis sp.]
MERLAGLSPAGELLVRSGESLVVHFVLADAALDPQLVAGATFELVIRRTAYPAPVIEPITGVLSGDIAYVSFGITPEMATAIHEAGQSNALSWNVVETTAGGQVTRFVQRVRVEVGADVLGQSAPVWIDLPVSQLIAAAGAVLVSERGARGDNTIAVEAAAAADAVRIATDAVRLETEVARDGAQEVVDAAPAVIEARDVAVAAKSVAVGASRKSYSAPYFYLPGTSVLAEAAVIGEDDRPREISLADGSRYQPDEDGLWSAILTSAGIRAITAALPAAALMFYVPGTAEVAVTATRYADGALQSVTGDGSATGVATQLIASPDGMVAVGAQASVAEPATIEADGGTITVPGGSIAMPGDRVISWAVSAI